MKKAIKESSVRAILQTYHQEARKYAAVIYWATDPFDASSVLNNGTCFAINISGKIIGITAAHVLYGEPESYFSRKAEYPEMELVIQNFRVSNMEDRIIDYDTNLDVVTFDLSHGEIMQIGIRAYETTKGKWPPPPPEKERGIVFMGFPSEKRKTLNRRTIEFEGMTECLTVTDVGPDHLDIQVRLKDLRALAGGAIPPLDRNLGGYSGAPVLVVSSRLTELWWPGGLIYKMPRNLALDENGEQVTYIIARRLNVINPDGTLNRGNLTA